MKLNLLSIEETEELQLEVSPIDNFENISYNKYLFKIQSWYRVHGLTTKNPQKDFFEKLSKIIGHKPVYYKQYEYRTGVWGFEWEDQKFILYRSEKGTQIEILKEFKKDKLEKFLIEFSNMLGVNNIKLP